MKLMNYEEMHIKYFECVFLPQCCVMHIAPFLCNHTLSCVASLAVRFSSTLPHKRHDLGGRKKNVCFDFLYNYYPKHTKKNSARSNHKRTWSSCKVPVILVGFYRRLNFLDRFSKKTSNIKFRKNLFSVILPI
jgi:hypothetical protein